jgi:hypothetical protein
MRLVPTLLIGAALIAQTTVAQCAWTVGADGTCVRQWAPSDLLRGPVAIANAPLQPVRTTVAGAQYAWNKSEWWPWPGPILSAAVTGASAVFGVFEGTWWALTGMADLLTGGYFEISPERATQRSVEPTLSEAIAGTPLPPTEDRCGRTLVAAK